MTARWSLATAIIIAVIMIAGCAEQPADVAMDTSSDPEVPQRDLKVAVACGVAGPYGQIKDKFEEAHPDVTVHQEVGNIVTMADQLRDGRTTADVFMTVGTVALGSLQDDGLLLEPPRDFAEDRLVVLVPEGNPLGIEKFEDLANENIKTIAIAGSKSTPGHFAEMALQRAGIYDQVRDRFVRPEQPTMLKGFVANGKADAAVMLLTCATKEAEMGEEPAQGVPGTEIALEVPHEYYDRLTCQVGILKDAADPELAREFADFLAAREPQQILSEWDFFPCEVPAADETEE